MIRLSFLWKSREQLNELWSSFFGQNCCDLMNFYNSGAYNYVFFIKCTQYKTIPLGYIGYIGTTLFNRQTTIYTQTKISDLKN